MDIGQRMRVYLGLERQEPPTGYRFSEGAGGVLPICETCGASVHPSAVEQHDRWHADPRRR